MAASIWGQLKQAYGSGTLNGGFPFAPNVAFVGANAPSYVPTYGTIQQALTAAITGNVIVVGPGENDENLTINGVNQFAIIGAGVPHSSRITALIFAAGMFSIIESG